MKKTLKNKKAQIMSFDLFIAASIFALILLFTIITFFNYHSDALEKIEYKEMMANAFEISDILIKTQGDPTNWNKSNVNILGLADHDKIISRQKAENFCAIPENNLRKLLGLDSYYFYFSLDNIKCGKNATGKKIVAVKRNVFLDNQNAILEFTVWR